MILLIIGEGAGFLSLAYTLARYGFGMPFYFFFQTAFLTLLWIGLIVLVWQRQGWARIVILLMMLFEIGSLALNFLRFSMTNVVMWTFLFPFVIAAVRGVALYQLFRPESSAWFKK